MPFIRVKVSNGHKVDLNVAHIIAFEPAAENAKLTDIRTSDGDILRVEDSAQAVRGAVRRAEAGSKEQAAPEA